MSFAEPKPQPVPAVEAKAEKLRDLPLDFIRGVAIFFMVTDHLLFVSGYSFFTRERFGMVTGAEIFVLISGVLIGHLYKFKILKRGFKSASVGLLRRAIQLYTVCLSLSVSVFLFSLIPHVNTKLWTTGGGMMNLREAIHFFGWKHLIIQTLLLHNGPLRMNVIGLYVILLGAAPIAMWFLVKGRGGLLLLASGLVWAINLKLEARVIATSFDNVFRVLSWQFLFVIGMVAGYYREAIKAFFSTKHGKWVTIGVITLAAVMCFIALNNPDTGLPTWARLHVLSHHQFHRIYQKLFSRKTLAPGRMLNVLCLFSVAYIALKTYWPYAQKTMGWFFVTIGQASLYVYILHAIILQAVYQIHGLDNEHVLLNTAVATGVLFMLWFMTRKKLLFWLIPR